MSIDFVEWLTSEMDERGWSNNKLAREAGVAHSTVSMIISRQSNHGWEFCAKVARAFGYDETRVFRIAGLLPFAMEDDPLASDIISLIHTLTDEQRRDVFKYIRFLLYDANH